MRLKDKEIIARYNLIQAIILTKFDDFNIDITTSTAGGEGTAEPWVTSKFLCTLGCVTEILMTCPISTFTCGCQITGT